MNPLNKYYTTYYVPSTTLGAGVKVMNKTNILAFTEFTWLRRRDTPHKTMFDNAEIKQSNTTENNGSSSQPRRETFSSNPGTCITVFLFVCLSVWIYFVSLNVHFLLD